MTTTYAKACSNKRRYDTLTLARETASKRMRNGAPPLYQYRCRWCHGWHLTRMKQTENTG